MKDILLIEDDPNITKSLIFIFQKNNMTIDCGTSLEIAKDFIQKQKYRIYLFDIGLTDGSGIELTQYIRRTGDFTPIILITARLDEDTLLNGFEAGATDYLRKPFSHNELLARVKANLRSSQVVSKRARYADLCIDLEARKCTNNGEEIKLNRRQMDILYYLVKNQEIVISRDSLLNYLAIENTAFDRTIDSHISQLRKKLKEAGVVNFKITSIYGVGYKIEK